jgi:hypothetical protein
MTDSRLALLSERLVAFRDSKGRPDPVGSGFVASLARPGGNVTGFTNFEFGMSAKWPQVLKQIAPGLTRVAVLRDPTNPAGIGQLAAIQAVAPQLRLEASPIDVRNAGEIERGIGEFARAPNGGLIVTSRYLPARIGNARCCAQRQMFTLKIFKSRCTGSRQPARTLPIRRSPLSYGLPMEGH